ncbi:unnamed protein product [Euphydryas editha]|uniref:Uncharacterized protein n=1 Tax=Euphydryas editha TaxID=104508 RepID=A0AAU9TPY7_EUPED|nr:unnamed protein product [Euphydryas editha]
MGGPIEHHFSYLKTGIIDAMKAKLQFINNRCGEFFFDRIENEMLITVNPQKPTCGAHVVLPVIMDLFAREALRTILMGEKIGTTHIFDFPNNLLLPYGRGYTAQLTLGGVSKIENIERFLPVDFFSSNTKILSLGQCYGYGYKMTLTNEDVVLREIEFSSQFTLELGIAKRFSRFQDWQTLSFCADGREMSYTRTLLSLFESMEDEEEYVSFELKSKTEQYQFTSAIDERMVEGAEEDEGSVEPFFNYTPEKEEQLKLLLADDDIDDYDAIYDAVADFYKDYKTLLLEITQLFENCGGVPPQKKTKKRKAREDNIESQDFDSNRPIFRDMVNYAINIGAISSTLSFLERICHLPLINLCRFILKTSVFLSYIDSGASAHLTTNEYWLENISVEHPIKEIVVANKEKVPVKCSSDVSITTLTDNCENKSRRSIVC